MSNRNRLHNSTNPYQGEFTKALVLCSAGLLRSPTTALILSQDPWNFNVRAAGLDEDHALVPVDEVLLYWADIIVCMTKNQERELKTMTTKPIFCLEIPDSFAYRDPILMQLIKDKCHQIDFTGGTNETVSVDSEDN